MTPWYDVSGWSSKGVGPHIFCDLAIPDLMQTRFKMGQQQVKGKPSPVIPVLGTSVNLVVLFLGIMSYMYGSLFRSNEKAHKLNVLAIDFDNGTIGNSFRDAYGQLRGSEFLNLQFEPASQYPTRQMVENAICSREYWGVIYTHPGATQRLVEAVSGNASYNPAETITYVYSGVHYPVIGDSFIAPKLQQLISVATQIFQSREGVALISNADLNSSTATSALFQPIRPTPIILHPADTGPRVLLNTVTMVVPPLMQFFFIMALDHISIAMHVFKPAGRRGLYLKRLLASKAYGLISGLAVTAFIYAFRENWSLTAAHFFETWMCFWFYMDICFQVVDSLIGTIVPMRFAPFFIFTWIIFNVTSTLFPFELNPGFYRWGYALPAHNIWWLLMAIWSNGCISQLEVSLPICFAWWVVGHVTSAYALRQKCIEHGTTLVEPDPIVEKLQHSSSSSQDHDSERNE